MSGRIALMVRGLPSIGIDEAVERFGKYYPQPISGVFHQSPSFVGQINDNNVSFFDTKTKGYSGGQGLTKQSISDLRKLKQDFENYVQSNPQIYTNEPTSESRAKLYRRVGFQDLPNGVQVLDARRIASEDLAYVQAIDAAINSKGSKQPSLSPLFLSSNGVVISSSRIRPEVIESALKQKPNDLSGDVNWAIAMKQKNVKKRLGLSQQPSTINILDPVKFVSSQPTRSNINEDLEAGAFRSISRNPERFNEVQNWALSAGLGQVTERNARTISRLHRDYQSALYRLTR